MTRYITPAPTTLTVPFVVPSSFTVNDLEALTWIVAGPALLDVAIADVYETCCYTFISLSITLKRRPPVTVRETLFRLHTAVTALSGTHRALVAAGWGRMNRDREWWKNVLDFSALCFSQS